MQAMAKKRGFRTAARRRLMRGTALLVAFLYIVSSLLPFGEGLISCHRADGNVVIEFSLANSCQSFDFSSANNIASSIANLAFPGESCGTCHDTPLDTSVVLVHVKTLQVTPAAVTPCYFSSTSSSHIAVFYQRHLPPIPPDNIIPPLFAISTVVRLT